ncbi:tetratricopeptide repeatcontaining protein [Entamoeba histolytica KU27]|uniref:Tetratricopeptide repeatcontaining protein n=2 Tax=Entamoeba histolytica TaxID=5759 RepID=M2Q032_ENTHI|nr:tetratricopeptide repeatcontaining protein [Entamoeba histolytica KU27]
MEETIVSLALLDGRHPNVLHEMYQTPLVNERLSHKIEIALKGDVYRMMKEYENIQYKEVPTTDIEDIEKLIIGVTLLNGFVRMNFVGPFNLEVEGESKKEVEYLSIDGEQANKHIVNSLWLHTSAKIFGVLKGKKKQLINLFIGREAMIHQRVLENPGESLVTRIGCGYRDGLKELENIKEEINKTLYERIKFKMNNEVCVGLWVSEQYRMVKEQLNKISQEEKIFVELSGAMGKRTKYQEKETAQLYVRVERKPHPVSEIKRQKCETKLKETELEEDNDMLSQTDYSGDIGYTPLSTYDEAYVLMECMNRYRKNCKSELILEEVIPYCNRVLRDRIDFSTFIMSVLLKSRYEATVTHFLWRSVKQADDLVKMMEKGEEEISSEERLESIYMTMIPNIFSLRKETGMRMLLMGESGAAINYFSGLDMKIEIVAAYVSMNEKEKAEEVARELLAEGNKDPELKVLMYEITNDPKYLIESWEESNHTYVHAERILGQYYFNKKEWKEAKKHFDIALEINPIYQRLWFALGICCMQISDIAGAKKAFLKGVNLDSDDGQSWANLAYIHSIQGNKREAQVALKEAVRNIRTSEDLWKNLIIISIDIKDYRQAISGIVSLYDVNKSAINPKILSMMCDVILQDLPMLNGETGRAMKGFMIPLLKNIIKDFKTTDLVYQVAKEGLDLLNQL